MQFQNKTALIIGASGGIGSAIAHALSKRGVRLLLVGRSVEKLTSLSNQLQNCRTFPADLSVEGSIEQLFADCIDENVDILINAVGVMDFHEFRDQESSAMESMILNNLLNPIRICRRFLTKLQRSESALIVNVGSTFGSIGHPGFSVYCATKFGMRGFSEALGRELGNGHIRVLYFAPRSTRTSLNSPIVMNLNESLNYSMDTPEFVSEELMKQISKRSLRYFVGWPEKFFVRVNAIFPWVVDKAIISKLPLVRKYF